MKTIETYHSISHTLLDNINLQYISRVIFNLRNQFCKNKLDLNYF